MLRLPACHPPAPFPALSRMDVVTGGASATYGSGAMAGVEDELMEVQVTGSRIISREDLGDYKLYRIDWPTDLNAHQSKQAAFLHAEHVEVERIYSVQFPLIPAIQYAAAEYRNEDGIPSYIDAQVAVGLRWKNEKSAGLGEPLPAGQVAVFEQGPQGELFAGQGRIKDQPVGSLVEFDFARAMNVSVEHTVEALPEEESEDENGEDGERLAKRVSHHFINRKNIAVKVEVQPLVVPYRWSAPDIKRASQRSERKNGDPLWVITIPAGGESWLSYEIRSRSLD